MISKVGLFLAYVLSLIEDGNGALATITDLHKDGNDIVKDILFCHHCIEPEQEGSHIKGAVANRMATDSNWNITAPLVYALPNHGSEAGLINAHDAVGAILMFDRGGGMSVTEQTSFAQHIGSKAVIIADVPRENRCAEYPTLPCRDAFTSLGNRNGVGSSRDASLWARLTIPSLLVTHEGGLRLKSSLDVVGGHVAGHGRQHFVEENERSRWNHQHEIDEL